MLENLRRRAGWWQIVVFSAAFISLFFVSWEIMEAKFLAEVPVETKKWLYIGRGVFGAICIGVITAILSRRHERRLAQMRQALIRQEKLAVVGQMAAGLAHEIGNPLASISAVAQILQQGKLSNPEAARRLELIGKEIDRIDRIVSQLVDFSRPEPGASMALSIASTLDEAIELARYDPRARNIRIERRYVSELLLITGVREHLTQAFLNIIYNAMDAMPEGGDLRISLRAEGDFIVIQFTDTGTGIAPDQMGQVFEPFFTTKGPGRGTGLGLAVTKHLITQHNGRIALESRPGVETHVRIELPLLNSRPSRKKKREAADRAPRRLRERGA